MYTLTASPRTGAALVSDPALPLRVALFYRDMACAARAAALVSRLTGRIEENIEVDRNLWSFEVLRLSDVASTAARSTAEADVVVIATSPSDPIAPHVRECLESAMLLRDDRGVAVVALLDRHSDPNDPAVRYLSQLCPAPEDSFFCAADLQLGECDLTPERVHQATTATSSVLEGIMRRRVPDPYTT